MNQLSRIGQQLFATGTLMLGALCIISGDFIVGRPPAWPEGINLNPALSVVAGGVFIVAALAMAVQKKAGLASLVVATLIFALSVLRQLPHFMTDWLNTLKGIALCGGALIVSASFYSTDGTITHGFKMSERTSRWFIQGGVLTLSAFFIACGYAHFKFVDFIVDFIPAFIPFHAFWAYFCGVCLYAGGVGILIPRTRRLAALLSGIMVGGWFLLLHIPRFIADTSNASDRMGLCESLTIAGIFFVLASLSPKSK